jgi:hypothetical protein
MKRAISRLENGSPEGVHRWPLHFMTLCMGENAMPGISQCGAFPLSMILFRAFSEMEGSGKLFSKDNASCNMMQPYGTKLAGRFSLLSAACLLMSEPERQMPRSL